MKVGCSSLHEITSKTPTFKGINFRADLISRQKSLRYPRNEYPRKF